MVSKRTKRPRRLTDPPKIRTEDGNKTTFSVPAPPPSKFTHCPGQLALDLDSDDPDAVIDPDEP